MVMFGLVVVRWSCWLRSCEAVKGAVLVRMVLVVLLLGMEGVCIELMEGASFVV